MIKEILKRGIAGAIISLVAIISMLLGVLVVTGTSQITIQISEIIKYTFIIMVAVFIISSITIIFIIKNHEKRYIYSDISKRIFIICQICLPTKKFRIYLIRNFKFINCNSSAIT